MTPDRRQFLKASAILGANALCAVAAGIHGRLSGAGEPRIRLSQVGLAGSNALGRADRGPDGKTRRAAAAVVPPRSRQSPAAADLPCV